MQENISVTDSYSTGNAAQAMLEKLLQIYDVKTLVAQLNGVGENHWSAAILKRALANDSAWHRLSEKDFQTVNASAFRGKSQPFYQPGSSEDQGNNGDECAADLHQWRSRNRRGRLHSSVVIHH